MARVISLSFPATNTQQLLSTTVAGGAATASISLNSRYPYVFQNLARTITLTSTDNLSGVNFIISGTNQYGVSQSETLAGPNNTVTSVNQYHTITNISCNGAYTNFSIGSGSTGTFQWQKLNTMSPYCAVTISAHVTGTINYSINGTLDQLEYYNNISSNIGQGSTISYVVNTAPSVNAIDASLTSATTSINYTFFTPLTALQGIVNSSGGGTLNINILQQGLS